MKPNFTFTGYVKSPAVPPEKVVALEAVGAPAQYVTDITPFKLAANIFDQQQEPSCVAHTVTWLVMYAWWKKTGTYVKLSPRFVYALCKTIDGLSATSGTTYQAAFTVIEQYGICEDTYFTNDCTLNVNTYTDATLISDAAKANALQYKAVGSFLSSLTQADLQEAIYQHGVIGIGTEISDYWWSDGQGTDTYDANIILPLKPYDTANPIVGGHAIALYAYAMPWDAEYPTNFWLCNWWDSTWAYAGRGCYGANYEPTVYEAVFVELAPTQENTPAVPIQTETIPTLLQEVEELVEKVL